MQAGKILKYATLTIIVANVVILAIVLAGKPASKKATLPNPNGYDDFVKATQALNGDPTAYEKMSQTELAALVSTNAEALKWLHSGLAKECRVPDDYSLDYAAGQLQTLSGLKHCAFLFCVEGRLAQLEGRTNDAARIFLDGARFAQESSRGGVMINKLVGIAGEAIALKPLRPLAENLDAKQCAEVAHALEAAGASDEPITETVAQENRYAWKVGRVLGQISKLVNYRMRRDILNKFTAKFYSGQINRRKVMIDFAARAYELDKGKPPANLADLVPGYLKAIPQDPTTGTNLVYKP